MSLSEQAYAPMEGVEALLNQAIALHQNLDLRAAESIYREVLSQMPDHPEANNYYGVLLYQENSTNAAAQHFQAAIAINPHYDAAHNNLGLTQHAAGDLDRAMASYERAIACNEEYVDAYFNRGNVFHQRGDYTDAVESFESALMIMPENAPAQNNRANALKALGRLDEAVVGYRRAVGIDPDFIDAHNNLGNILREQGKLEEAAVSYAQIETDYSKVKLLECLYTRGEYREFYRTLDRFAETDTTNIGIAAVSAFASHQLERVDPYPFCRDPLNFLHIGSIQDKVSDLDQFIAGLIDELAAFDATWEPDEKTTKQGYQTEENIFSKPAGNLAKLADLIKAEMAAYRQAHGNQNCAFIQAWPQTTNLEGWHVRLLKSGHQESHIHVNRWLSGVFYLKLPQALKEGEGAIEFSLHGFDYPILKDDIPRFQLAPEKGQLILFPASLFHRTLPFSADDDRLSIAFDLVPDP